MKKILNGSDKLVSIIVPAYNVEKYIYGCLDSILTQTYRNIEVIVVDDGSSDGTWDIIESLMAQDSRVKGYKKTNGGVSSARNFALQKISGYYCQFVDADDYISESAVETLVNAIEQNNADWVNFQYHRVDENSNPLEELDFITGYYDISKEKEKFGFIRDKLIEYLVGYEVCFKLFRTDIIRENNLIFDEKCKIGEDLEFNITYCLLSKSIECIEDRLYYYVIRNESATGKSNELQIQLRERLILLKGIQKPYESYFSDEYQVKFYQIFYKLIMFANYRFSAKETVAVAPKLEEYGYYINMLKIAVSKKQEFYEFYPKEMAMVYWRFGYYIIAELEHDIKGKLYFAFYNIYRCLRKRPTIGNLIFH
ncbi:glycosyltransferase family 2 protein [Butyrivibrio sp. WCD2001]|uniref:glycosyltransferase family 2 protein n=1 Tax=Butyrivibrio sp. WCD2001 TaxID=1280681 RepID=UPI0004236892|nr:glycosyltransferase family 2 protein [Butyrivibrio sp. WCD2001]